MQQCLNACSKTAAGIVTARLSTDDWNTLDSSIVARNLQDAGIISSVNQLFPQEILDIICGAIVEQELSSLKVKYLRRF